MDREGEKRFFVQPKESGEVIVYRHIKEERIDYYIEEACTYGEKEWTCELPVEKDSDGSIQLELSYQIKRNPSELEEFSWISGFLRDCRKRIHNEFSPYMEGEEIFPPLYAKIYLEVI